LIPTAWNFLHLLVEVGEGNADVIDSVPALGFGLSVFMK